MDEYLFITLAKLKADRLALQRQKQGAEPDPEQLRLELAETAGTRRPAVPHPVLRTALTLAVSVAISLTTLAALQWSATRAPLPAGEVTIVQIEEPAQLEPLAQVESRVARAARSSL